MLRMQVTPVFRSRGVPGRGIGRSLEFIAAACLALALSAKAEGQQCNVSTSVPVTFAPPLKYTFTLASQTSALGPPLVGDFNGDGTVDFAVLAWAAEPAGAQMVLDYFEDTNTKTGGQPTFAQTDIRLRYGLVPYHPGLNLQPVVFDVNHDGIPDIVFVVPDQPQPGGMVSDVLWYASGSKTKPLTAIGPLFASNPWPEEFTVTDGRAPAFGPGVYGTWKCDDTYRYEKITSVAVNSTDTGLVVGLACPSATAVGTTNYSPSSPAPLARLVPLESLNDGGWSVAPPAFWGGLLAAEGFSGSDPSFGFYNLAVLPANLPPFLEGNLFAAQLQGSLGPLGINTIYPYDLPNHSPIAFREVDAGIGQLGWYGYDLVPSSVEASLACHQSPDFFWPATEPPNKTQTFTLGRLCVDGGLGFFEFETTESFPGSENGIYNVTFPAPSWRGTVASTFDPIPPLLADMNGDGQVDLLASTLTPNVACGGSQSCSLQDFSVVALCNDTRVVGVTAGMAGTNINFTSAPITVPRLAVGDFNGDGKPDVLELIPPVQSVSEAISVDLFVNSTR